MGYQTLARYYDAFTQQNMDYKKRTEFICALLFSSLSAGGFASAPTDYTILDLACGTGIYSQALFAQGYDVIGVDASADMLSVARERNPQQLLLQQGLEQLDLYGTAQAAVCLTDSLNHITNPAHVRKFFKRLALFLEPGSPFIFDINTLHKHEHVLGNNTFVYENNEATLVWHNRWLPEQRMTEITLDFGDATEQFCERVYSVEELSTWLGKAGFAVEKTLPAPGEEEERIFILAFKR
ncbi:MAG: methyltransferase domain-containing protein [Oscillospiraceae bacterium]|jgi:SAM-dependent methyltransferase|nr:methyltransferase domain-containing protein [Oscillospiraceae bacterium]